MIGQSPLKSRLDFVRGAVAWLVLIATRKVSSIDVRLAVVLFACLFLGGCPAAMQSIKNKITNYPIENQARDLQATAQGFIQAAQQKHQADCSVDKKPRVCQIINQAVAAQNVLVDVAETYCGWPSRPTADDFKNAGPCEQNKASLPALQNAVRNLNGIMADLKSAAGGS